MEIPYIPAQNYEVLNRLLNYYNLLQLNRVAEVGVRTAVTSEYLLRNNPKLELILVDFYKPYQDVVHYFTQEEQDELRLEAKSRLEGFEGRVWWEYEDSVEAASMFDAGYFDAVFVDACHDADHVRADCEAWISKVRSSGWLMGHDVSMDTVGPVVRDIAKKYGKILYTSPPTEGDIYWMQI